MKDTWKERFKWKNKRRPMAHIDDVKVLVLVNLLGALWLLSERDETFPEANY